MPCSRHTNMQCSIATVFVFYLLSRDKEASYLCYAFIVCNIHTTVHASAAGMAWYWSKHVLQIGELTKYLPLQGCLQRGRR